MGSSPIVPYNMLFMNLKCFNNLDAFDLFIGIEQCKPLLRLFCQAFVLFKENKSYEDLPSLFSKIQEDDTSHTLYNCLNLKSPLLEDSFRNKIRIALLILDSEIGHNLIFMLTGIDVRAILICAHVISEEFLKTMFDIDIEKIDNNRLLGEEIEDVLGKELQIIKLCIKNFK